MSKTLERAVELAKAIRNNPNEEERLDDTKFFEDKLASLPAYFSAVISHEIVVSVSRFLLEPEDYRDRCESVDKGRRMAHEIMTISINQINRLCKVYGVPQVFVSEDDRELDMNDINDRMNAALYSYGFCKEVFMDCLDNIQESYTDIMIGAELCEYAKKGNPFRRKTSLDLIIEKLEGKQEDAA